MSLAKYIKSLLPSFERNILDDDLTNIRNELRLNTLPPLEVAVKHHGKSKFTSDFAKSVESVFEIQFRHKYKDNIINPIHKSMLCLDKLLDFVTNEIHENFYQDISTSTMNLKQATLLRYVESAGFAIRYSRKLLDALLAFEIHQHNEEQALPLQVEVEWLKKNLKTYCDILNILHQEESAVKKAYDELPEVTLSPETADMVDTTYGAKADPLKFGLVPVGLNPIYGVRMVVAKWQANRVKQAQEEKLMLELRVRYLKELRDGNQNAGLERQIETIEGRLAKAGKRIRDMEEKYGL